MLIYGLDYIKNQFTALEFELGLSVNNVSCVKFSKEILAKPNIKRAIFCDTLSEVLQSNAALCEYIIPNAKILKDSVFLAEKYLFDSKILSFIKDTSDIEKAALIGVDAVLFCDFKDCNDYYI